MRHGFPIRALFRLALAVSFFGLAPASGTGTEEGPGAHEFLSNLSVRQVTAHTGFSKVRLSFSVGGQHYDVTLQESRIFAPGAMNVWSLHGQEYREKPRGVFYSGSAAGFPGSRMGVRLDGGALEGVLMTPDQIYFLEPARYRQGIAHSDLTLAYRLSDVLFSDELECGFEIPDLGHEVRSAEKRRMALSSDSLVANEVPLREVEIRLFLDSHYSRRHGVDSAIRVQTLVHSANALYEDQGIAFRIAETFISLDTEDDRLSDTLDAVDLLSEFSNSVSIGSSDLAHLVTGRDLDGSTIGMAWRASICDPDFAVGLSQDLPDPASRAVLMAHEIGHNLGASHDGSSGACSEEAAGRIMWPWIHPESANFSNCSSAAFNRNLERASCVAPISRVPLAVPGQLNTRTLRRSSRVLFSWDEVSGAQGYFLDVYDTTTNSWRLSEEVPENSFQSWDLIHPKKTYRWRVRAVGVDGMGEAAEWQVLRTNPVRLRSLE